MGTFKNFMQMMWNFSNDGLGIVQYLTYGIAVLVLAVSGFRMLTGGSSGFETAFESFKRVLIGVLLSVMAVTIVCSFLKMFSYDPKNSSTKMEADKTTFEFAIPDKYHNDRRNDLPESP